MIFGDGERPRASGLDRAADRATAGFVVAVRAAAGALWVAREDAVKRTLAPLQVDEVDVIAYLVADALGRPLLHPDDCNALGKRVLTQATRAEAAIKAAEKTAADAVRRAKATAAADPSKLPRVVAAEVKGAADVAAVRGKSTPDLQLPSRTVGKRMREPEPEAALMPPPPPPPPPLQPLTTQGEAFALAVARAVREELSKAEAARNEAAAEAAAEAAVRAKARNDEAALAAVPMARAKLALAERELKREKKSLANLGPAPPYDPPELGCPTRPRIFRIGMSDEEYIDRTMQRDKPYDDWHWGEQMRRLEAQWAVRDAESEVTSAAAALADAEACVVGRGLTRGGHHV